jgi:molecular chaperone GrpE
MEREPRRRTNIKVQDKRRSAEGIPVEPAESTLSDEEPSAGDAGVAPVAAVEEQAEVVEEAAAEAVAEVRDYLDDLRRLQAEFDNYRKRVLKEQTLAGTRAIARMVEKLLPVLDNFERAVEHGAGDEGIELILKDLKRILQDEGVSEIAAEGMPFDPQVHEAVESVEDPDVSETVVKTVYRKGYRMRDRVLRPAMVVVARPAEDELSSQPRAAQG